VFPSPDGVALDRLTIWLLVPSDFTIPRNLVESVVAPGAKGLSDGEGTSVDGFILEGFGCRAALRP